MLVIVLATFISGYAIGTINMFGECKEALEQTEQRCSYQSENDLSKRPECLVMLGE